MPTPTFPLKTLYLPSSRHAYRVLPPEGFEALVRCFTSLAFPGGEADVNFYDTSGAPACDVNVALAWSVGCNFSVRIQSESNRSAVGRELAPKGDLYFRFCPSTSVQLQFSWSATHRSLPSAQAATNLYQKMIDLGAMIASALEEYDACSILTPTDLTAYEATFRPSLEE